MAELHLENVTKIFARPAVTAVDHLSLRVQDGELLALLGPSGCGKTTLLRLIAGLEVLNSGTLSIDGKDLDSAPPESREVGMAFQYPTLLPQLTVEENIGIGPKLRGLGRSETAARVRDLARQFELENLLSRAPETLSGGQQQRVSLARALANRPAVLLLDEPLANIDPGGRAELREAIRSVQRKLRVTTLYVTHDQAEAAAVGDRIAVMRAGRVEQVGTAPELYLDPASLFVAQFFGPERPNVLPGELKDGRFRVRGAEWELETGVRGIGDAACVIRPRAIRVGSGFNGTVKDVGHSGWNTLATVRICGVNLRAELDYSPEIRPGDPFQFMIRPGDLLLFDSTTGARIR